MSEAKGADYQRRNPLPPADTVGVATVAGRNFHASTDCPGYKQAIRNTLSLDAPRKCVLSASRDARMPF